MPQVIEWEHGRVLELAYIIGLHETLYLATVCACAPVCMLFTSVGGCEVTTSRTAR